MRKLAQPELLARAGSLVNRDQEEEEEEERKRRRGRGKMRRRSVRVSTGTHLCASSGSCSGAYPLGRTCALPLGRALARIHWDALVRFPLGRAE